MNHGAQQAGAAAACLGWGSSGSGISGGLALYLRACDGTFEWGESFYRPTQETGLVHGAFYFDPFRNYDTRGAVQPADAHNLTESKVRSLALPWLVGRGLSLAGAWHFRRDRAIDYRAYMRVLILNMREREFVYACVVCFVTT